MKTCTKCDEVKSLTEFYKRENSRDGHRHRCKSCLCAQWKAYREANPEKIKACKKAWRKANLEKAKARSKAYYEANLEKVKARSKAYYEANPEKAKARSKAYREANLEKVKARKKAWSKTPAGKIWQYRNGAKSRNIPFLLTEEQFKSFWQAPCSYCGDEIETIGLDRINSDGPYRIDNVRPCCWPCNSNKGTRSLEEWTENTLKRAKMLWKINIE